MPRFVMRNRLHGHKIVAPSESSRDALINSKKLRDNKSAWEVFEELSDHEPDRVPRHLTKGPGEYSIEELEAMLQAKKESEGLLDPGLKDDPKPAPAKKKAGRPKAK